MTQSGKPVSSDLDLRLFWTPVFTGVTFKDEKTRSDTISQVKGENF
jgi:hypothetical protein